MNDHQLIRAIALKRDQSAFKILFDRYQNKLYGLALRITHNPDMAEDAVQSALLAVWNRAKTYQDIGGKPSQWLFRIVAVESIKTLNVDHKQRTKVERKAAMAPSKELVESPDRVAEKKDSIGLMREAIKSLPPLQQQLLTLYYEGEMRQADIGKALDMPQRTVSAKLEAALAFIRKSIGKDECALATPVFGALLLEALSSDVAPMVDLWTGIMEQMSSTPPSYSSVTPKPKGLSWAAILGVPLLSGMLYVGFSTQIKQPVVEPEQSPIQVPQISSSEFRKPSKLLRKIWRFSEPDVPPEFTLQYGTWRHKPKGGVDGTGCMVVGPEFFRVDLSCNLNEFTGSLKITFRARPFGDAPNGGFRIMACWQHCSQKILFNHFGRMYIFSRKKKLFFDMNTYIQDNFFDTWVNEVRTSPQYFERDLSKEKKLYFVSVGAHEIDKLIIEQVKPEACPSIDILKPYIARIPKAEGEGEIVFSELPSALPEKQVLAKYKNFPKGGDSAAHPFKR